MAVLRAYINDTPENFRFRTIEITRLARKALIYHHIRWLQLPYQSRGRESCETLRLEQARKFTGRLVNSLSNVTAETLEEFHFESEEYDGWGWEDLNLINVMEMA
jgi:hypothetical protein